MTFEQLKEKVQFAHGSGLDAEFEWTESRKYYHLHTWYHYMNDAGYYDGWIPVHVYFPKDETMLERFYVRCRNTGKYIFLRDYLESVFGMAITRES